MTNIKLLFIIFAALISFTADATKIPLEDEEKENLHPQTGIYAEIKQFSDELPKMTPVFKMTPVPDQKWEESSKERKKEYVIPKRVDYFFKNNGFLPTTIILNSDDKRGRMFIKMDKREIKSALALEICFSDKEDKIRLKNVESYIDIMIFNVTGINPPEAKEKIYNFGWQEEMSWKFIKGCMFHNAIMANTPIKKPFSKEEQKLYSLYDKEEFRNEIERILLHVNSKGDYSFYVLHDNDEELKRGISFFESLNKQYLENIEPESHCCIF